MAAYAPGDIVTVQWCLDHNGDHGGVFSYGICQEQDIVDKLLDPSHVPTEAEKAAAEFCFEAGLLPCTDVQGQTCEYSPDCSEGLFVHYLLVLLEGFLRLVPPFGNLCAFLY